MTKSLKQKLTIPLFGFLAIMLLIIGGYIYLNKLISEPIEIKDVKIDTKAALKLNILKQISKKNGITEWELTASSATLLKDQNKAILIDVTIIFYTSSNKKVHLTSRKGILNTKTHDMEFSDNVIVKYESAILRTEKLQYKKKEHIILSKSRVKLEQKDSEIISDSMITNLNDNTTIMEGHVRGIFSEEFDIQ